GFEIAASAPRPVAVISFADEEGARFNTPTFGSKALSGRLDLPAVLDRRDDGGVTLGDAMRAAGVDPGGLVHAPPLLHKLRVVRAPQPSATAHRLLRAGAGGGAHLPRRAHPPGGPAYRPGRPRGHDPSIRAPGRTVRRGAADGGG